MYKTMRIGYLASLAALTSACSLHPLPEDVTAVSTEKIVALFRCEFRDALRRRVVNAVRRRREDAHLADDLENGSLPFDKLRSKITDRGLRSVLDRYAGATILFDFSLTMTQNSDASGGLTLTRPFTSGSRTLGFTIVDNHQQQNIRTYTVRDTFEGSLSFIDDLYCAERPSIPNYDYPIAGQQSKIDEQLITFLNLNQSGNLVGPKDKLDTPTMADDLQFTTKKIATVSPALMDNPISHVLSLTGLNATLSGGREDIHRVTIVLALPPVGSKPTPHSLAESDELARNRLMLAQQNRFNVSIEKIQNFLTNPSLFQ